MSTLATVVVLLIGALALVLVVTVGRSSRESTSRARWILAAVVGTAATYFIGGMIAYGDSDRDPNVASFASLAMAVLVVISIVIAAIRRQSAVPITVAALALGMGVVGVTITLLAG